MLIVHVFKIILNLFFIVCGVQTNRKQKFGVDGLNKMASHGDWPWHAILFKSGTHVCDGTLISSEWLLTSASCFQGYLISIYLFRVITTLTYVFIT